jgi:hypothetical protein
MKDIWQLPVKSRLRTWRTLRKEIEALDDLLPKLEVVTQFWKMAPISVRVIDPYNESTWPNPWDLLHANEYDENVVSLGIAYTLYYSGIPCKILLVQSVEKSEIKLIVSVDNCYILNYNYDIIDNLKLIDTLDVLKDIDISTLSK